MLELILVLFLWGFVAHGLWKLSAHQHEQKIHRKLNLVTCLLWPIALPIGLLIVLFRRN